MDKPEPDSRTPSDSGGEDDSRRRGCLLFAAFAIVALAAGLALFFLVLVPAFRPEVDPDIEDIRIKTGDGSGTDSVALRGSLTDRLFQPREREPEHPLDPVLEVARLGLDRIDRDVRDYSALMVKQERVNGKLLPEETMRVKVRHAAEGNGSAVPLSFYLRFEKPESMTGREVIWVEGVAGDRLIAHEGGLLNLMSVRLNPTGMVAMTGNRYPITELGIRTLIQRMIEKGERDRPDSPDCEVEVRRDVEIDGDKCTLITIRHPQKRDHLEFHMARIYVNDEIDLPVGYEGFDWPAEPGGEPVLMERYFYRELKLNPGFTDADFDPENPEYRFP